MLQTPSVIATNRHMLTCIRADHPTRLPAIFRQLTGGGPSGWTGTIKTWFQRSRQRSALAGLDDRLLRDIGIIHAQARHEAAKPFWAGKS